MLICYATVSTKNPDLDMQMLQQPDYRIQKDLLREGNRNKGETVVTAITSKNMHLMPNIQSLFINWTDSLAQ